MASKKTAGTGKTTAARAKTVEPPIVEKASTAKAVWTLPIALLMLCVAAAGLLMAVRDSSNPPQAASSAVTNEASAPAPNADPKPSPKPSTAPAAAAPMTAAKDSPKTSEMSAAKPVSITGCLKRADNGFVLKDTEGTDAPKSRSWKSGFFKRSSTSISLNDSSNATHLADHVGQRVSVTGPLTDREMRVMSLRRVAATCE